MVFLKLNPAFFSSFATFKAQDHLKAMRFGQCLGGFEITIDPLELKRLATPVWSNGVQSNCAHGQRRGGFAFGIKKIQSETGWHLGFEHADFQLTDGSLDYLASVGTNLVMLMMMFVRVAVIMVVAIILIMIMRVMMGMLMIMLMRE